MRKQVFNVVHFQGTINAQFNPACSQALAALALGLPDTPENGAVRACGYALKNKASDAIKFLQNRPEGDQFVHDSSSDERRPDDEGAEYESRVD